MANKIFKSKILTILLTTTLVSSVTAGIMNYSNNKELKNKEEQIQLLKEELEDTEYEINRRNEEDAKKEIEFKELNDELKKVKDELSRKNNELDVVVTAYDLSEQSCGKSTNNNEYGITATGKNLKGHTVHTARAIAVDPSIIPLGSKVKMSFKDNNLKEYNGIYTAVDTGSSIKGNKVDLFLGENQTEKAIKFGVQEARIEIL